MKDGNYLTENHRLAKIVNGKELFYSPKTGGWRPAIDEHEAATMNNPSSISPAKAVEKKRSMDESFARLHGTASASVPGALQSALQREKIAA